ncbi:hypothetical protein FXE51_10955 [Vibrio mimicus]|nr:hypothetical protein VM_19040 [Vibrio mimicus]EMB50668.1 hypothetical protein D908_07086 [Vibrio mimicus CAIM 602]TXY31070.1 hypothetical protein FXE86_10435 [Vibrio mimicus]TXZ75427.1 hypothetical protein FXE51_10955 [Vibrio mimicus]
MIKVVTQFIHRTYLLLRNLRLVPLIQSHFRFGKMIKSRLNIKQFFRILSDLMSNGQCTFTALPLLKSFARYESMIMVVSLRISLRPISFCVGDFKPIRARSLSLSDIARKSMENLHASVLTELLIIDPQKDHQ